MEHTLFLISKVKCFGKIEHEATTSKIGEDQVFYCNQRGIPTEKAIALIVNGFSRSIEQITNGIRSRSSEIIGNFVRRFSRIVNHKFEYITHLQNVTDKNLHASVEDKDILKD